MVCVRPYLLLATDPVPRDRLADLLWPQGLPREWRRHLAAVVSKLRRLLPCLGLDPATALPGGGHAETTFKALRRWRGCPWRIGDIVAAALVVLHHEHHRTT